MKTTIDIPEPLYREAKIRAVETGQTLKQIVLHALEQNLHAPLITEESKVPYWSQRKLRPGYAAALNAGAFSNGPDSTDTLSEDRSSREKTLF